MNSVQRTGSCWQTLHLLLLICLACALHNCHGIPIQNGNWEYQQQLYSPAAPSQGKLRSEKPFTPGHRDPYDHKVDSVGKHIQPLPFRNGDGATIMGPRNKDRERQNPDIIRPPSTDHGTLPNMRWSFADSHTRTEVRCAVASELTLLVRSCQ